MSYWKKTTLFYVFFLFTHVYTSISEWPPGGKLQRTKCTWTNYCMILVVTINQSIFKPNSYHYKLPTFAVFNLGNEVESKACCDIFLSLHFVVIQHGYTLSWLLDKKILPTYKHMHASIYLEEPEDWGQRNRLPTIWGQFWCMYMQMWVD